jgi:vesicle-associated membrane protein 7
MVDNIDKILDRGDRISLLVDRTSTMQDSAFGKRAETSPKRKPVKRAGMKLATSSMRAAAQPKYR